MQRSTGDKSPVIRTKGDVSVSYKEYHGPTQEEYAKTQKQLLKDIVKELRDADDRQRFLLEQKLQTVQAKLADIEQSYEENKKLLQETCEELEQVKGRLPDAQIEKAQISVLKGNTEEAEHAFDVVADEAGRIAALAAFRSGRLAEDRLWITKRPCGNTKRRLCWRRTTRNTCLPPGTWPG